MNFGDKLNTAMQEGDWKVESLAFKTGLAVRTISNAKSGKSVSRTTFKRICKALGRKFEEMKND